MPNKVTEIERKIDELSPADFQKFCDSIFHEMRYPSLHSLGLKEGSNKTTKGIPDSYFRLESGKYVFVTYTTEKNIIPKLEKDINDCLNSAITGIDKKEINEIICCHTSSNISASDDKKLHDICKRSGVKLTLLGINELAMKVCYDYPSLANDFLDTPLVTDQILSVEGFVSQNDQNEYTAPLKTNFMFRSEEKKEICEALNDFPTVIVTGKAGVGKTRLVLEAAKEFAEHYKYKLLCIKNKNLEIYHDLVRFIDNKNNYILFIDDANEFANLELFFSYKVNKLNDRSLKIILTVRDYAKEKVINTVREKVKAKTIEIACLENNEIEEFIKFNLNIRNRIYIDKIIRISNGNPRIAYMAGRLAIEKNNWSFIESIPQLYDVYYKKYVNEKLGIDTDLCIVACILACTNGVKLGELYVFNEFFKICQMTISIFKKKVNELNELEFVEINDAEVAIISDQCLANYMLYYVFFKRRLISLYNFIKIGYKHFRHGLINGLNTILNLFPSEEVLGCVKQEVIEVWDYFENNHDDCYKDFVKDFKTFNPESAFSLALKLIDKIQIKSFNPLTLDISKNEFCSESSLLNYLTEFKNTDYLNYVIELISKYCEKNEETFISGINWLKDFYGIGRNDYRNRYNSQILISKYLYESVSKDNVIINAIAFYWAKYCLGFCFDSFESMNDRNITFYKIEIRESKEINDLRKICWEMLMSLSAKECWKEKILELIDSYSRNILGDVDKGIVKNDFLYVKKLLTKLKNKNISYLRIIERLSINETNINISLGKKLKELLGGEKRASYQLFRFDYPSNDDVDYETRDRIRKERIKEYSKNIDLTHLFILVQNVNSILSDKLINDEKFDIESGFNFFVQNLNETLLKDFIIAYFRYGENIQIHPNIAIKKLIKQYAPSQLLSIISNFAGSKVNEWQFAVYESIQKENVTSDFLEKMLNFLSSDSDKFVKESPIRNLIFLDNFINLEPNIYVIACSIIHEKRRYSNFIAKIYLESLFNEQNYAPKKLYFLFKENLELLKNIYFYIVAENRFVDYDGSYLLEFLNLNFDWLIDFSKFFWNSGGNKDYFNFRSISALREAVDYNRYFDYLFYNRPKGDENNWRLRNVFAKLLKETRLNDVINKHQTEWVIHIVTDNAFTEEIYFIFNFLCEVNENLRRKAIETFLNVNHNADTFAKLTLFPFSASCEDSLIPVYAKRIEFLKSLYPLLEGIKFLNHKLAINKKIEFIDRLIKKEETDLISRNLYM